MKEGGGCAKALASVICRVYTRRNHDDGKRRPFVTNDASSNKPNLQKDAHHQQLQLLSSRVHLSRGSPRLVVLEGEMSRIYGTREGCGAPAQVYRQKLEELVMNPNRAIQKYD